MTLGLPDYCRGTDVSYKSLWQVLVVRASAAGGGVYGFGVSPDLGGGIRLLRVDVAVQLESEADWPHYRSHFSLHRGTGVPTTRQEVQAWERIIDFGTFAGFHGMVVYGTNRKFNWELTRLFSGEENKFGVVFYNASTVTGVVHVFFRISEA